MNYRIIMAIMCSMQIVCAAGVNSTIDQKQIPDSFGKTHFIVGHQHDTVPHTSMHIAPSASAHDVLALFSPDDNLRQKLIDIIDQEKKAVQVAVFLITDPDIAYALIRAHKRGVMIELVVDVNCLKERASKVALLCEAGCSVFIYNPPASSKGLSIMHNKFVLCHAAPDKPVLWTGSFNFTRSANDSNQENALVIKDQHLFEKYASQFNKLKSNSYRYGKKKSEIHKEVHS